MDRPKEKVSSPPAASYPRGAEVADAEEVIVTRVRVVEVRFRVGHKRSSPEDPNHPTESTSRSARYSHAGTYPTRKLRPQFVRRPA